MKKILCSFVAVSLAGTAAAHESGIQHTHTVSNVCSDAFVWSIVAMGLLGTGLLGLRAWQNRRKI